MKIKLYILNIFLALSFSPVFANESTTTSNNNDLNDKTLTYSTAQ